VVQFTHILCPTDLSDLSRSPVTYAAALARRYAAHLTLLHVVPTFDPMSVRPAALDGPVQVVYPVSREEVLERLEHVLEAAGAASPDATCAADAGDPSKRIVDHALAIPADLIVIGTHGRGGFERFMIGSVAEKVLHKAPCPVLTVPPHVAPRPSGDARFEHILCAIDFSPSSLQAFGFALELARQFGASLAVLHVIEWLAEDEPRAHAHFNVQVYHHELIRDARERVQALIAEARGPSGAIEGVVHVGRPHRAILRLATELPTDLIVMGAQGRGGVGLALFGSTTQQVVRAAQCPVLTARLSDRVERWQ
jgi:nucleotide-binding universal stress UspA family protein